VAAENPNQFKGLVGTPQPRLVLLIELDNDNPRTQKRLAKKVKKILEKHTIQFESETEEEAKDRLWKIRHSAATLHAHANGGGRALPIIDDGVVPIDKFTALIDGFYELIKRSGVQGGVWGHAGDANLHMQPILD